MGAGVGVRGMAAGVAAMAMATATAGCSDDGGLDGDGGVDAVDAVDAIDGTGGDCVAPIAAPAGLESELAATIAQLTRTADRASAANRATARTYLRGALTDLGLTATLDEYGGGANVVARLPATVATEDWIVVGAHFDSVSDSPGANDNASGTATVLAVARALRDLPCRGQGVMFVLFDQEEIGLVGSTQFAGRQFAAGTRITAAHTIDQVGWDADDDLRFEIEKPAPALWTAYQAGAAAIGVSVVQTDVGGTDHESFRERGYAAAGVTEEFAGGDTTPHYHQPSDTAATVELGYVARAARLVTYVVARALGAP